MKTFYIGLENQLLMIQEKENTYDFISHLEKFKVNCLVFDPGNMNWLYAATNHGFWKSEDGGRSYKQMNNGLPTMKLTTMAVSPHKNLKGKHTLYVGTEPSMIFYSEDRGENWEEFRGIQDLPSKSNWSFPPRPETHYVRWITPSKTDPDYLAVSIEAGAVFQTSDHGKTWSDRAEVGPTDVHTLLMHPDAPSRLYATNGGMVSNHVRESYAESFDGGHSWTFMSGGLEKHPYTYNMILHPNDPDFRLISASESASKAHDKHAYSTVYCKNGEEDWLELADGLPKEGSFSHHLAHDPNAIGAFYALNNYGIYYLGAESTTWEKVDIPWAKDLAEMRPYFFQVIDHDL